MTWPFIWAIGEIMSTFVLDHARISVAKSIDLLNRLDAHNHDARHVAVSKRLIAESYELLAKVNHPVWTAFIEAKTT